MGMSLTSFDDLEISVLLYVVPEDLLRFLLVAQTWFWYGLVVQSECVCEFKKQRLNSQRLRDVYRVKN